MQTPSSCSYLKFIYFRVEILYRWLGWSNFKILSFGKAHMVRKDPNFWYLMKKSSCQKSVQKKCKSAGALSLNPNQTDVWEALPGLGGGSGSPPLLSWLWSKFLLKNHVSLKAGINSNSFGPFLEFFFKNHQKNQRKLKIHQKMAKNERNF